MEKSRHKDGEALRDELGPLPKAQVKNEYAHYAEEKEVMRHLEEEYRAFITLQQELEQVYIAFLDVEAENPIRFLNEGAKRNIERSSI